MRNLNTERFWMLIAGVSVVALLATAAVQRVPLTDVWRVLALIPTVATVDAAVYGLFAVWLWRWPAFQGWLIPFPDLNGTWTGEIVSEWRDENGDNPGPIITMLTIRQRFVGMSCVMRTEEMESRSYAESLSVDPDAQLRRLCYTYTSRPRQELRDRSTPHDGTVTLNILGSDANRMEGEYWTQRGTRGTVILRRANRGHADSIAPARGGA